MLALSVGYIKDGRLNLLSKLEHQTLMLNKHFQRP